MKKIISVILSIAAILSVASGCSKKEEAKGDVTTLKWVLMGPGEQKDSQMVWDKFNEELAKIMPEVQIDFEVIAPSDFGEKWRLMASANEPVDIAWNGWLNPLEDEVHRGSFIELDELIDQYAPELKEEFPEWIWEKTTVDDKIYAVPNYQMMANLPMGFRTPKDLADKYFNWDEYNKIMDNWENGDDNYLSQEFYDFIYEYLMTLKENGELKMGASPAVADWIRGPKKGNNILPTVTIKEENGEPVANAMLFDKKDPIYANMNKWYNDGLIRKDVLSVQDVKKEEGLADGYVLWAHNYMKGSAETDSEKYGFPIEIIPVTRKTFVTSGTSSTSTAITRMCKNPELAMKFIALMNTAKGKDLLNLLAYGIEGTHYKKISDNRIETIGYSGTPTADNDYGVQKWTIGNTYYAYETQTEFEGYNEYIKNDVNGKAEESVAFGFKPDVKSLNIETAQLAAIEQEYKGLYTGAIADWETQLDEKIEKAKKAGIDKLVEEVQKQLTEWKAKN